MHDKASGRSERLVFATRTAEIRIIPSALWSRLDAGFLEDVPGHVREELAAIELLVPTDEDELATVVERQREGVQATRDLYLVIQPSAACQLGCNYCGQEHSQRRLSTADQDAFVRRAAEQLDEGQFHGARCV